MWWQTLLGTPQASFCVSEQEADIKPTSIATSRNNLQVGMDVE